MPSEACDLCHLKMSPNENGHGLLRGHFYKVSRLSVSVGPDSDAHAGSAETDAAAVFIAASLDVTLARSISVSIAPVADDNMAFATFAPAATIFIADHANVLNVALRYD